MNTRISLPRTVEAVALSIPRTIRTAGAVSLFTMIALAPTAFAAETRTPATDYTVREGIMVPDEMGDFHSASSMTRLEFALTVIDRYYGDDDGSSCFRDLSPRLPVRFTRLFRDVSVQETYAKKLCVGMVAGLVSGDAEGNFRPHARITMAEASKILARANGLTYPSKTTPVHPWYWSSMEALRWRNAISPTAKPDALLTRGDAAQMFYGLRSQERFPESRVIGGRTLPVADTAQPDAAICEADSCDDTGVDEEVEMREETMSPPITPFSHPSRRTLRNRLLNRQ